MSKQPIVAVLYGGVSAEREVSLGSGKAAAESFARLFETVLIDVDQAALPAALDPERHVVFSTLHGTFGEDGQIQTLMEAAGVAYAGCDAASSAVTFDKVATKRILAENGVPVLAEVAFDRSAVPSASSVIAQLGASLVIKPRRQGSSVGLAFSEGESELANVLSALEFDEWLIEPRVVGREITIGVLDGEPLEIVEIRPKSGRFDYRSKYTKGETEYVVPAPLPPALTAQIKAISRRAFEACGCRDFARIDLMIDGGGNPFILEINTLPGLKETSLLPKSAGAVGIDFENLLRRLVGPAFRRHQALYSVC